MTGQMTRLKSALVVLITLWAIEAVIVLPVMWIGGASGAAMGGAFVFAGIVAVLIVGVPIAVAESRRRRDL